MPEYFMKTERIGFSHWKKEDLALAKSLWGNEKVTKYICASGTFSEEQIRGRLLKEIENQTLYTVQYWPIFLLKTGDFIGCCGLRPYGEAQEKVYEIGFHLRPAFWGIGLGKEGAKTVIEYAFHTLKAKDLFAGHHPENAASAKMLEKLGFTHTHDEYYEPTGLMHPSYRYKSK